MLRYFQKVSDTQERPQKRQKAEDTDDSNQAAEPCTFLTWNVNSLPTRCKDPSDIKAFCDLVSQLQPDVIALQEARLTAHAPEKAKRGDGQPRDRSRPRDNDKASKEEWQAVKSLMERAPFNRYNVLWSLADWRYAGTATLYKKTLTRPIRVEYNLNGAVNKAGRSEHDENGRVCMLHFPSGLAVLNTYAPNNGWKEESFFRRQDWDAMLLRFVRRMRDAATPLVWLGDLNVAHREPDVTHPDFFRVQVDRTAPRPAPADAGQPGFTPNEQLRFGQVLDQGALVDTYRHMNPGAEPLPPDQPAWTWRGSHHPTDKYHNRGMRIDYALVSDSLSDRIAEASILGRGADRTGFFGSDHCPVFLRLHPPASQPDDGPGQAEPCTAASQGPGQQQAPQGHVETGKGEPLAAAMQPPAQQPEQPPGGRAPEPGGGSGPNDPLLIKHDKERCRFLVQILDGQALAGFDENAGTGLAADAEPGEGPYLSYVLLAKRGVRVMDIDHTYTPEAWRGKGIAAKLCAAAFEHCRGEGIRVIASCSYVRERFVPSRPDLADLMFKP